jgi:predicted lipoprotein with Yx(FWY)xxD motif
VYSVHDTKLGDHLLAANGMTLYRYTKDTANTSKCTGTCADSWPPYVSVGPLKASSSTPGKLATTTRPDGSIQITYKGMPLYFWKGDTKSGDATGEGVGGVWFVVKP